MTTLHSVTSYPDAAFQPAVQSSWSRRRRYPFSQFVRYASPDPLPTRKEFYWGEFKRNFFPSQLHSIRKYKERLKNSPLAVFNLIASSLAAGVIFTVFRKLRPVATYVFALGFLGFPIVKTSKTFPKMAEAYDHVQHGSPGRGREVFRQAMNDSIYSIFYDFLKPIVLGRTVSFVLCIPGMMRGHSPTISAKVVRTITRKLGVTLETPPIRWLDMAYRYTRVHGRACSRRIQRFLGMKVS